MTLRICISTLLQGRANAREPAFAETLREIALIQIKGREGLAEMAGRAPANASMLALRLGVPSGNRIAPALMQP
jgi:hypothetical protein